MNTNISEDLKQIIVTIYTQRWSNIGLAIAFFSTALFTYIFINTELPNLWGNITDSTILSIILSLLLFIPVAFILILCIVAYEYYKSITSKILLLICFSFLTSILLVFVLCVGVSKCEIFSNYSIGVFFFYTLLVVCALFVIDTFLLPVMTISASFFLVPIIKTILSIPLVFIIWYVTDSWWIWLITLQVFTLFYFYNAKTSFTWMKINKLYVGDYKYKSSGLFNINMFSYNNYKRLGLYLSLYNFLPNIFMFLNSSVDNIEIVNESIDEELKKKEKNILDVLDCYLIGGNTVKVSYSMFSKKNTLYRIIIGLLLYISFCCIFYYMGDLFVPIQIF